MDKNEIKNTLMENPKYDSGWIDNASELMANYEHTENFLSTYSAEQLSILIQANKDYPDDKEFLSIIYRPSLNVSQMTILLTAKSKGIDNSIIQKYADPDMPYAKMNYALQAVSEGFNIHEEFNLSEFNTDQVYEIYAGYITGVDYKVYANPNIEPKYMGLIRHAMELDMDVKFDSQSIQCFFK